MKTKLAILLALASTGAYAQLPVEVPAPESTLAGQAPKLYPSEQGAFKVLEVISQLVESRIVQKGCQAFSAPLEVHTDSTGAGTALVGTDFSHVGLAIALGGKAGNNGRFYTVTGSGSINGMIIADINAIGSFNIGSATQELSTYWTGTSYVTRRPDNFKGTVIKDYTRLADLVAIPQGWDDAGVPVSMVIDYGYQQVSKNNYVKGKYWQQSVTWREDGVNAGTWWRKTRVAPKGCAIEVRLAGYGQWPSDSFEGFNEKGTISVSSGIDVGPYSGKK